MSRLAGKIMAGIVGANLEVDAVNCSYTNVIKFQTATGIKSIQKTYAQLKDALEAYNLAREVAAENM